MLFKTTFDLLKCLVYERLSHCYLLRLLAFRLYGFTIHESRAFYLVNPILTIRPCLGLAVADEFREKGVSQF